MKPIVCGYMALRYGLDYIAYAIRSVIDICDEFHVLYATQPSHGHYSVVPCPETREQLFEIAVQAAGDKLRWHDGNWTQEGEQRGAIYQYMPHADVILSVDSDEIYSPFLLAHIFQYYTTIEPYEWPHYIRLPFIHYWRSFNRCVMHDPAYPARLIFPNAGNKNEYAWRPEQAGVVNHMGYAIRPEIMHYKWLIHGHLPELRHDVNWYQDVYLANRQFDCHPVGSEWWNPEEVNPLLYMPYWMIEHPFFGKKVIE